MGPTTLGKGRMERKEGHAPKERKGKERGSVTESGK